MPKTIVLPDDFFTRFDWDSADLDKLGNATAIIEATAAKCVEIEAKNTELDSRLTTAEGDIDQLTEDLAAEVTRAEGAESALDEAIKEETSRAEAAEQKNVDDIAAEVTRATTAEQTLQSNIDAEKARAEAAEQKNAEDIAANKAAIEAEVTRATEAEQTLQTNINAEKTRAEAAEKANADAISAEQTRAEASEQANAAAVTAEQTRAEAAEAALAGRVSTLEETHIWHGSYTFASVPANATQSYAFQLDVTYKDVDKVSPYVICSTPDVTPYLVLITQTAFTVGIRNTTDADLTNVKLYAQAVGEVEA